MSLGSRPLGQSPCRSEVSRPQVHVQLLICPIMAYLKKLGMATVCHTISYIIYNAQSTRVSKLERTDCKGFALHMPYIGHTYKT